MFNPYAPPRGKSALIASLTPDRDDLPSLDSLNPDNLKDLTKEVLSDLLKAHNVIPGGSKPEMKKQVRTLIHSINSNTPLPTSIQMPKVSNIAMPAVPTGTMHPAAGANTAQQLASTHKVQTQLQMKLVNEAAHYAQQIAFHRMTMRKDDQAAFYSCPRCDKVLGVNGSQLWRHVQSEHPDLFVPLLKQNIYNGGLVGDQSDILSLSKEAAQERINTTAQWLKELFSPSLLLNSNNSNVNNSDKDNDHTRLEKIKGYESRLESLVQSFDHRISTSIESIQSDSNLFYQFYNQLSEVNTIDELENLTKQYEKVKNIHFSPKPLLITPILNQQSQPGVNNDLIIQQL
ncbi:hypothetical protein DFA_05932 [Cavenderia fasciculata]|uniref:Uncharacterized protein n=1 Tax=Cavenderia fasciculata TaxID=261658 RepID=F4PJM2_CACFS|nr:uncharacterized protein DFA_05932 [Cavenderia fasciculata]EGG23796.1 hypothetical protein DFA_05932 [Cavenderia fasciculata]|eukprot:XP_004361647.1 hypothetical protein DFA_05932 [Cavenderia fasciculata]